MSPFIVNFILTLIAECAFAMILIEISKRRIIRSLFWVAINVTSFDFLTIFYVKDAWLIIPNVLGAVAGTYLAMKYLNTN